MDVKIEFRMSDDVRADKLYRALDDALFRVAAENLWVMEEPCYTIEWEQN
jgi:hypothetical protein